MWRHLLLLQLHLRKLLLRLCRLPLCYSRPGCSVCRPPQMRLLVGSTAGIEWPMGPTIYRSPTVPAACCLTYASGSTRCPVDTNNRVQAHL